MIIYLTDACCVLLILTILTDRKLLMPSILTGYLILCLFILAYFNTSLDL